MRAAFMRGSRSEVQGDFGVKTPCQCFFNVADLLSNMPIQKFRRDSRRRIEISSSANLAQALDTTSQALWVLCQRAA